MDRETALFLNRMTCDFYRINATSFSATRQAPWDGWLTLADALHGRWDAKTDAARTVTDLACGNLRFERFLTSEFPGVPFVFRTWDDCDELVGDTLEQAGSSITFVHHRTDIVKELISTAAPSSLLGSTMPDTPMGNADLAVCFGFFHHIPTPEARTHALEWLLASVRTSGIIAISLWRFADDERARAKAELATERALFALSSQLPAPYSGTQSTTNQSLIQTKKADRPINRDAPNIDLARQLGQGDYLLGWKNTQSSFRYCHSFNDEDIDRLIESISRGPVGCAKLIARYRADGKNGRSNEYLVFQNSAHTDRTEGSSGAPNGDASDSFREGA